MRIHIARSKHTASRARQNGAALVVGMIMLAILTLLAITAMNTSSTELVMAGNEQFRERAFQMGEAGIEQAVRNMPKVKQTLGVKVTAPTVNSTLQPDDSYTTVTEYVGDDDGLPGFSAGKFTGIHYTIESTGLSVRNARSVQQVGAFLPGGGTDDPVGYLPGAAAP